MLDISSFTKARIASPAPSPLTNHPNTFPIHVWIRVFVFRIKRAILVRTLQVRRRVDLRKRPQVFGAYATTRSATVSCQPLEIRSAQNSAVFSTCLRSCSFRDGGEGLGVCCLAAVVAGFLGEVCP